MVVDIELEAAKYLVLKLIQDRRSVEEELVAMNDILDSNNVGMSDPLVDSEGYPRNNIDVSLVRHARHTIICLRNEHRELVGKIEYGLTHINVITGEVELRMPTASSFEEATPFAEPFLKVNLVSSGSPAEVAGIEKNDLIMEFGSVNLNNFKSLKDIESLMEHNRYERVIIKVKRDSETRSLTLIPRPWSGQGLLGCNVIALEMVER